MQSSQRPRSDDGAPRPGPQVSLSGNARAFCGGDETRPCLWSHWAQIRFLLLMSQVTTTIVMDNTHSFSFCSGGHRSEICFQVLAGLVPSGALRDSLSPSLLSLWWLRARLVSWLLPLVKAHLCFPWHQAFSPTGRAPSASRYEGTRGYT